MFHLGSQLAETYFRFCVFSLHTKRFNIQISVRGAKIVEENFSILPNIYVNMGILPTFRYKMYYLSCTWGKLCFFLLAVFFSYKRYKDVISFTWEKEPGKVCYKSILDSIYIATTRGVAYCFYIKCRLQAEKRFSSCEGICCSQPGCFLSSLPLLPPATIAVFCSYLPSLYS